MKKLWILALMTCLASVAAPLAAQEPRQESQPGSTQAPEQEARDLEKEMVRMVKNLLAKSKPGKSAIKSQQKEAARKARFPEPASPDTQTLRDELSEWKSKSLAALDMLTEQKLAELESRQEQQTKKLIEKIKKQEKVILNPKHRPGGERAEQIERLIDRELKKIDNEFEKECWKIERESKKEKDSITQLFREMEKALLPDDDARNRNKKAPAPKQRKIHKKDRH